MGANGNFGALVGSISLIQSILRILPKQVLHGEQARFDNQHKGFHLPPVETRSWFHTGIYFDEDSGLDSRDVMGIYRKKEFYDGDNKAFKLPELFIENKKDLEPSEVYEAYRALRGAQLRSEVYVHDGSDKELHPYTVTESSYQVKTLQEKGENKHAVFFTTANESLSYHYERNPADPRISQTITLAVDELGNVTDKVSIGYPRREVPEDIPEQGVTHIVYSHVDFINQHVPHSETVSGFYYAGIPYQTRDYEITGLKPSSNEKGRYSAEGFPKAVATPPPEEPSEPSPAILLDSTAKVDKNSFQPYQWQPSSEDTAPQRRIIEWTRSYFRTDAEPGVIDALDNLEHRLPLGEIQRLALPFESYQAAFDQSLLDETFGDRLGDRNDKLVEEGGYRSHTIHSDAEDVEGYWWIPSGRQDFNPTKFFQSEKFQDAFGHISSTTTDIYALLPETARDALPESQTNVVTAKNDYRVLQPHEVIDPNGNHNQVKFDALGFVVGTAVWGTDKDGQIEGDSLEGFVTDLPDTLQDQHFADPLNLDQATDTNPHNILKGASTRLVYDLHRYRNTGEPNVVYTLTRETHVTDEQEQQITSKIQHAFTYSDGFGREWQSKVQAEPKKPAAEEEERANPKPRWVGTGSIIFNNKGKPVQQFEPFFSDDHLPGIEQQGVSPTLFYDPLGRVVCTFHPNHSYEKVVFDPWQQASWDGNDTVLLDPREDEDVRAYTQDFFVQYDADYLTERGEAPKSWLEVNSVGTYTTPATTEQKAAATQTQQHANTPGVVHLDSLGRPVLTIEDNGKDTAGQQQLFRSRVVLDIEGNQREVIEARGLPVMRYGYDMTRTGDEEDESGTLIYQNGMDGGERWLLHNVAGNPIRSWDSRGHVLHTTYDELQRPQALWLSTDGANEILVEQISYGETQENAQALNLKGQVFEQKDGAGLVTFREYDFKGNPVETHRQLLAVSDGSAADSSDSPVDWSKKPARDAEVFVSTSRFDALNRPVEVVTPHTKVATPQNKPIKPNIIYPVYNEANLLERMEVKLQGADKAGVFVSNIDYNARGQRKQITCVGEDGKTVFTTTYEYEPETFRLSQLITTRASDKQRLQNLSYTYDPVGNITSIRDTAQQTVFFKNAVVEPHCVYVYDPMYRLVKAEGREHAQHNVQLDRKDAKPAVGIPDTNNPEALQRYTEEYVYDAVGNILSMAHSGGGASRWKRCYQYAQDSNRLLATSHSLEFTDAPVLSICFEASLSQKYEYDAHGSMVKMPHLPVMGWDFKDQLLFSGKQVENEGNGEKTHYRYDAGGERVRKFTILANGNLKNERLYLGGFEVYREYNSGNGQLELARETLHVMDDQQRVALVETKTVDTEQPNSVPEALIRFQLGNHLGSASLELSGSGEVITYEEYHPFGTSAYRSGKSKAEVSSKRYRYTGMERDEETGLAYHSARYYLPWLGRWGVLIRLD
ncbi:MAG: toxin TcdB middle/C-terminal domain-containing protein [Thiolinea sp.]